MATVFMKFLELWPGDYERGIRWLTLTLLAEGGRLIIVEEVEPEGRLARWLYHAWRWPWAGLTWFLTRSTTYPLRQPERLLAEAGFRSVPIASHLGGSLRLLLGQKEEREEPSDESAAVPELKYRVTVGTLLRDLYCLLMRMVPPYPSVRPGLYRVGRPGRKAPVLVTGNYDLTVRRLLKGIRGLDAYLLVADSRGINVWCAAGGGHFTAEKVIAAVKSSGIGELVDHRRLILP